MIVRPIMTSSGGRTKETTILEVKLDRNGRLLVIQRHIAGTNFWVHPDGTYSYCPTEADIETLRKAYEAIDNYNKDQMFKKNVRQ